MYISSKSDLLNPDKIINKLDLFEGAVVAELGCGAVGFFTVPLAKIVGNKGTVYAVDVLKPVLENIESIKNNQGLYNITPIWADIEIYGATRIKDESCDAVLLVNICFQVQDHESVMREALRILKKGGKMLVIDWNNKANPYGPPLDHRVKKDYLMQVARNLNLRKVEQFDAGKYHYGLLFDK